MKKLTLTIAIVLGLGMGAVAQQSGGGLFQRGYVTDEQYYGAGYFSDRNTNPLMPVLPGHNSDTNEDANGPLGSGIAVLVGLGAAYLVGKRRKD